MASTDLAGDTGEPQAFLRLHEDLDAFWLSRVESSRGYASSWPGLIPDKPRSLAESQPAQRRSAARLRKSVRWIVERSIAGFNRCRRLAKDWKSLNSSF